MDALELFKRSYPARRQNFRRITLAVERLESRLTPYSLSGNAWPHANLITISFEPDGTNLGGPTSNLFATFNAKFGSAATWENQILKGAQQWAQQTNINFVVVSDNGTRSGAGSYQQGDPAMGDIRIGGYSFGNSNLAMTYMPPPSNNYSVAGDMVFNTGQSFNIGATYDLFTVAMHEFGHALGLLHSSTNNAVMYSTYQGNKNGLTSDDISGIRAIYGGARSSDSYDPNGSFSSAASITGSINSTSLTALVTGMNITTSSELDYFSFTAPSNTTSTLTVKVQSQGLSLLAPKAYVYNVGHTLLASTSGAGHYGTTLTLSVTGIAAGATYFVEVAGADTSAFGTGVYALTLNFGSGSSPTVPLPNTKTLNGSPLSGSGGVADSVHPGQDQNNQDMFGGDNEPFDFYSAPSEAAPSSVPSSLPSLQQVNAAPTSATPAILPGAFATTVSNVPCKLNGPLATPPLVQVKEAAATELYRELVIPVQAALQALPNWIGDRSAGREETGKAEEMYFGAPAELRNGIPEKASASPTHAKESSDQAIPESRLPGAVRPSDTAAQIRAAYFAAEAMTSSRSAAGFALLEGAEGTNSWTADGIVSLALSLAAASYWGMELQATTRRSQLVSARSPVLR